MSSVSKAQAEREARVALAALPQVIGAVNLAVEGVQKLPTIFSVGKVIEAREALQTARLLLAEVQGEAEAAKGPEVIA